MHLIEIVESQKALGGTVQIGLVVEERTNYRLLFDELWLELFRFEKAASRFLENSELTRLNRQSAVQSMTPRFRAVLMSAQRSAEFSSGLFNPFVLPAVQRTGYIHSVNDPQKTIAIDVRKRRIASPNELEIGDTWAKIPPGTALDLGGCGKGHIIDVLADKARENKGVSGGWIEADGDIFAWGHDAHQEQITIAVQSSVPGADDFTVLIPETGLGVATSGTFARPNLSYAKNSHHIIDPRTNQPAKSDIALATVCAKTGLEADVLASCAIIVGLEDAPAYLEGGGATDWILQTSKVKSGNNKVMAAGSNTRRSEVEARHA
jgi:thiamine biosynthesis lipoprotein